MLKKKQQIVDELKYILIEDLFVELRKEQLKEEDILGSGVGLDSVGLVELITIVEDKFNVRIEQRELEDTSRPGMTLGGLAQHIEEQMAAE